MAITSPSSPPSGGVPIDIEAWTEQTFEAFGSLNLSPAARSARPPSDDAPAPAVQAPAGSGISVTLDIPLDEATEPEKSRTTYKRREPLRRDSLKRREALLKGKEGSRQRRRWENAHLLSNPYMTPPLPSDWEVRPPTHNVPIPYYLAPLWDAGLAAHSAARREKAHKRVAAQSTHTQARKGVPEGQGRVPKDFKEKMKKSKGARGLLQDLEENVRDFVREWREREERGQWGADSEDEELVLVGRDGECVDLLERELCLFESSADDHAAAFCRYLVHQIGTYYGLETWSVTTGDPARREAYVGMNALTGRSPAVKEPLPRPLWGLV